MIARALAVAVFPFASLVAQNTFVVDPAGPYTQISAAIAAAQAGDRIEVHAGSYLPFTVSIGLDIVAPSGSASVSGGVVIQNLPAAYAVRIDGLSILATSSISSCAGIVHLHRVTASDVTISSSPRVAVTRSSFAGGLGVVLVNSNVVFDSCSMHGAAGSFPTPAYPYPGNGGIGLQLQQSHAFLSDCTVVGGDGAFGYPISLYVGYGAAAANGDATSSLVAVGNGSFAGGYNGNGGPPVSGLWGGSTFRLGPGVSVTSPGTPVTAIIEPPHLIAPTSLLSGTNAAIQATGTADQAVLLGIDIWNDLIVLPGVELPFVLTTGAALYAFAPPTPASSTTFALAVPSASWLLNQFVHLQAVTISGSGTLQFSTGGYGRIM